MAGEPVAISALPWLWRSAAAALVVVVAGACALPPAAPMAGRRLIEVPSSLDGTKQPSYLIVPPLTRGKRVPLCVSLHTWQGDHTQRNMEMEAAAARRGWIYLFPNFRGPNDRPEACGSEAARRDILDAIAWVARRYPVDTARIYLVGVSGGGHMAMLMAGRHPERFAAISAWVGISDLAAWHATHAKGQYGAMLRRVCGGPPGANADVDRQYRERS
ncbi:MAG: prolyl oligopeptidase, partial [Armatimonadetes bacterium]|nr:prolyl oligopeptidase [Armatimonadota bacterium]